ncbi:unnamed protein product [Somion occarium]|uniref:Enoyl reductase (ER) domain-containing protein n=1 Tax=Somion occarium TaxID=3059160 RepID=A0ABP1D656_9APHY
MSKDPTPQPHTMRAWTFSCRGLPKDVLKLDYTHPVPPPPTKGDLLIRVSYVGLNPGCVINMSFIPPFLRRFLSGNPTAIPEGEFAGVVHLAGPSAPPNFSPGTRVFGNIPMMRLIAGLGTLAEYIIMPSSGVAVVPASMSLVEASGLSGAGQTAMDMFLPIRVKEGHRVLVNGSSGGVGIMAVQIAKAKGAYVVATCSEASFELVKSLGVDEVVDYRANVPLHAHLADKYGGKNSFDFILDTIGTQDLFTYSPSYLKPEGQLINVGNFEGPVITVWRSITNRLTPVIFGGVPRDYLMISVAPTEEKAANLARMVEEGTLKVIVDDVVEFEDVVQAYHRLMRRDAKGKIIAKVHTD